MLKWVSEWISKSDKIDCLIYQIRWRQWGGIEIRVECWGWSRRRWVVGLRMRIACHILWYCCSLLLRPPSLALELKWSATTDLTIYEYACVCVNSIPRSFYSTRISLFVYYTFDFPPNWLATHVMSCPCCLVFVLLVVGALLKLVAGGQNSLIEPLFFFFFINYVAIYTVLKTRRLIYIYNNRENNFVGPLDWKELKVTTLPLVELSLSY